MNAEVNATYNSWASIGSSNARVIESYPIHSKNGSYKNSGVDGVAGDGGGVGSGGMTDSYCSTRASSRTCSCTCRSSSSSCSCSISYSGTTGVVFNAGSAKAKDGSGASTRTWSASRVVTSMPKSSSMSTTKPASSAASACS